MNHDILDVPKVPRQRAELQSLLNGARYQQKRARIKRIITIVIIVLAFALLFLRFTGHLHVHGIGLYLGSLI